MRLRMLAGTLPAWMLACTVTAAGAAPEPDTVAMRHEPLRYQIVVSATRAPRDAAEIPNATAVVRGADLRRHGTRTLAEALQDVVGLDTGEGSDNGMRLPNLGLWGLQEFDALLVTVDGVPVGGPFNPSLAQVPIEEIERIEIVKGPQGTLYGVSAFAGMVQVFTREHEAGLGHLALGGGSFEDRHGALALQRTLRDGTALRLTGAMQSADGWQDRTGGRLDRAGLSVRRSMGPAALALELSGTRDTQRWGTPLPFDAGKPVPGFEVDRNYAVRGARVDHHVWSATLNADAALGDRYRLQNTFGFTRDQQLSVRSFPSPDPAAAPGTPVPSEGVLLRPREDTAFDDLHLLTTLDLAGRHELVTGTALTWGRTTAAGIGFDFNQVPGDPASIPELGAIPAGDVRSFEDRRTFFGAYARDTWTPHARVSLSGGGRWDRTSENLHAQTREQAPGAPLERADDARREQAWSGDLSALVKLLPENAPEARALNLYGSWRSAFKPAAPNLAEAEGAEILDPERTRALEGGLKARVLDRQLALDLAWFDMRFENMVVSTLGPDSLPELVNAGKERFKGFEATFTLAPGALPGTSLLVGYAHHDPRFERFTFVTPEGELRDVSGKQLELAPRERANARLDVALPRGVGVFGAVRHVGRRPLNRRNTFFAGACDEWDAGISYTGERLRLGVAGRNLGDDRHVTSESEIGDSQYYISPPRRLTVEASVTF